MKEITYRELVKVIKDTGNVVGQLYPVLVDFNNQLIDGQHRKAVFKEKTKVLKLDHIKTKEERLLARLIANHVRKPNNKSTWVPTLSQIAKILQGEGVDKIGLEIARRTGIPYRTIIRYLPDEYKDLNQSKRAKHSRLPTGCQEEPQAVKRTPEVTSDTKPKISVTPTLEEKKELIQESHIQEANNLSYHKTGDYPEIEIKKYANLPWTAILIPNDFFYKLRQACDKKGLNIEKILTISLVRLHEDIRKGSLSHLINK